MIPLVVTNFDVDLIMDEAIDIPTKLMDKDVEKKLGLREFISVPRASVTLIAVSLVASILVAEKGMDSVIDLLCFGLDDSSFSQSMFIAGGQI